MTERPIDIWNEMTTTARETGRCMFCEAALVSRGKRPVVCPDSECNKAYHRLYRHLVRNPRERNEPAEVARVSAEERLAIRRTWYNRLPEEHKERYRELKRQWYQRTRARDGSASPQKAD